MPFLVFRIKSGWFSWVKRACKAFVVSICESLKQGCDQQKRLAKYQSKFRQSLKQKLERNLLADTYLAHKG